MGTVRDQLQCMSFKGLNPDFSLPRLRQHEAAESPAAGVIHKSLKAGMLGALTAALGHFMFEKTEAADEKTLFCNL